MRVMKAVASACGFPSGVPCLMSLAKNGTLQCAHMTPAFLLSSRCKVSARL